MPPRGMHSCVHSQPEYLLCATSISHIHSAHKEGSLGPQAAPLGQPSPGQVLTPQDTGQGHRGGTTSSKGGRCRPPSPVSGLLTIPEGKLQPVACPCPLSSHGVPLFLSSSPSCPNFFPPHSSLQPSHTTLHREAAFSSLFSLCTQPLPRAPTTLDSLQLPHQLSSPNNPPSQEYLYPRLRGILPLGWPKYGILGSNSKP